MQRCATILLLLALSGCSIYRFGTCSLYRPDVRTVHVPMITSASFRRNLGEQLTEAVVKEIERQTPYKVVSAANADSVLEVRLDSDRKNALVENEFDEPRVIETGFQIHMTWRDRRGNLITRTAVPLDEVVVNMAQSSAFIPEGGQSLTTAQQEVIQRLAQQIVGHMEAGW